MTGLRYAVVYARTRTGYSAHVPDLPGCIATGKTLEQTKRRMAEAVALHIRGMQEDGDPIPAPTTVVDIVQVNAA